MKNLFSLVLMFALACIVWAITPASTLPTFAMAKQVAADALGAFKASTVRLVTGLYAVSVMRMAPYSQAFQSAIGSAMGLGVIGEFFLDAGGSSRVQPGVVKGTAENIVVGRWFTRDPADGLFLPGGDAGVPGGILMSPKEYSTAGTAAGGALAPTLTLLAGTVAQFCTNTPGIIVALSTACAVGDGVFYDDVTGVLGAGVAGVGQTQIAGAAVVRFANAAPGLAVVSLLGN